MRLVFTSSVIAMMQTVEPKLFYDEKDWSDESVMNIYAKSKARAERLIWDFVEKKPEDERFEVVVICPPTTIGPAINSGQFEVGQMVKGMMLGDFPNIPIGMPVCDVRDCAFAHF